MEDKVVNLNPLPPTATRIDDLVAGQPGRSRLARHPLLCFSVLAFALSWLAVIPYAFGGFPAPVLASGPFLAAVVTAAIVGGTNGLRAYFVRLFRWRVSVVWYVVALLAPMAGWAVVAYVNVLLGAAAPSLTQLSGWWLIGSATLGLLINPFAGAWEEPGWRGYALPLLLRRHSALTASAVVGVIWALWHVPLFVVGAIPWPDAAVVFAVSFIFTAIYLRTRAVLVALVFHAALNGAGEYFVGLFDGADQVRMYWILAALCALISIVIIVVSRDRWRRVPADRDNEEEAHSEAAPPVDPDCRGQEGGQVA